MPAATSLRRAMTPRSRATYFGQTGFLVVSFSAFDRSALFDELTFVIETLYLYELKQTVTLEGEKVALVGRKNLTKIRSGAGTTLEVVDRIGATLAEDGKTPE